MKIKRKLNGKWRYLIWNFSYWKEELQNYNFGIVSVFSGIGVCVLELWKWFLIFFLLV